MKRRRYKVKTKDEKLKAMRNQLYHANSSWSIAAYENIGLKARIAELEEDLALKTKRMRSLMHSERTYKELAATYIEKHAEVLHELEVS
jgi:hypothetical protein